ncbi:MAG: thioredoxin [Clostridiales bacterium]|nr:thioredoxin [Clostridiales bacterium]
MKKYKVTALLIVISLALIIAGIMLKQPDSVMSKAVRICMECVGIG